MKLSCFWVIGWTLNWYLNCIQQQCGWIEGKVTKCQASNFSGDVLSSYINKLSLWDLGHLGSAVQHLFGVLTFNGSPQTEFKQMILFLGCEAKKKSLTGKKRKNMTWTTWLRKKTKQKKNISSHSNHSLDGQGKPGLDCNHRTPAGIKFQVLPGSTHLQLSWPHSWPRDHQISISVNWTGNSSNLQTLKQQTYK